jgi:hypothetical protein
LLYDWPRPEFLRAALRISQLPGCSHC